MNTSIQLEGEALDRHRRIINLVADSGSLNEEQVREQLYDFLDDMKVNPSFISAAKNSLAFSKYAHSVERFFNGHKPHVGLEVPFITGNPLRFSKDFTIATLGRGINSCGPLRHIDYLSHKPSDTFSLHNSIRADLDDTKSFYSLNSRDIIIFFILLDGSVLLTYPHSFCTFGPSAYAPFRSRALDSRSLPKESLGPILNPLTPIPPFPYRHL